MKNTQSASATPGRLRRRLTSARLVLGLSAPLAFTMVLALATSAAADEEFNKPGPPTLACQCTTNPVTLSWAPETRRIEQPLIYRMYIGSRPGQADLGIIDLPGEPGPDAMDRHRDTGGQLLHPYCGGELIRRQLLQRGGGQRRDQADTTTRVERHLERSRPYAALDRRQSFRHTL